MGVKNSNVSLVILLAFLSSLFGPVSFAGNVEHEKDQEKKDALDKGMNAYYKGDFKSAYNFTIPLATKGNPAALNLLGMMYELGRGVPQDAEKSVSFYRRAAEQGDVYAQYNLAVSYDTGNGIPMNYREAVKWYTSAAEKGASFAQYNLGVMYEQGRGTEKSYKKAAQWYQQAARQGHSQAQNNLGWLYEVGQGVDQNLVAAYAWFDIAAEKGLDSAKQKRDQIKHRLNKNELKQALMDSRVFKEEISKNSAE